MKFARQQPWLVGWLVVCKRVMSMLMKKTGRSSSLHFFFDIKFFFLIVQQLIEG